MLAATLSSWAPLASAQTVADIKKKGELTIGMLVDFPPYGTMNASNQPDGYDADVARLLAKDLGVKLNLVPVTGPNRIPFLLTNKVDLLVASLAGPIGRLPILVQAILYLVLGIIWILPLRPLLIWMETGRFR